MNAGKAPAAGATNTLASRAATFAAVASILGLALPERSHPQWTHRRIRFADPTAFKGERDRASAQAMEELAKQAQELRLGYE